MNSHIRNQKICLKEFIPKKVLNSNNNGKSYDLSVIDDEIYLTLYYDVDLHNKKGIVGKKRYNFLLPK